MKTQHSISQWSPFTNDKVSNHHVNLNCFSGEKYVNSHKYLEDHLLGAGVGEGDGFRGVFHGVTTEHGAHVTLVMIHLVDSNEQTKILIRTNLLRRHDEISTAINK